MIFVIGGRPLCKRDALPAELTAQNQITGLFITLNRWKQDCFYANESE